LGQAWKPITGAPQCLSRPCQAVAAVESGHRDLAVELQVDLRPDASLLDGGNDLDNFLYPVIDRLDRQRFVSARATKGHFGQSTIRVGPAIPLSDEVGWSFAAAETTGSTANKAWKTELANGLRPQPSLAREGALELEVAFVINDRRNWTWLWKPAIDSLAAIVGRVPGAAEFNTRDDRITRLAVHRGVDESLGWRVRVGVWWRLAP